MVLLETNRWYVLIGALAPAPSIVLGENLPTSQRKAPDGNKDVDM